MQDFGILHRDIKNANILLCLPADKIQTVFKCDKKSKSIRLAKLVGEMLEQDDFGGLEVKLGDFGFATYLSEQEMIRFYCGTPLNMAPEILNDRFYNHKVDIWSIGVAIFECIFQSPPFTGNDKNELIRNVNEGIAQIPKVSYSVSNACFDFLSKCLRFDPEQRITIDHALNHPFINPSSPQYLEQIDIFHPIPSWTKNP